MPKMPKPARPSLAALLARSQHALGLTQETLGELLGVSRTTMNRWQGGRVGRLIPSHLVTLAGKLVPADLDLASELAVHHNETLETLGLVARAPPPVPAVVAPRVALPHLVDSVVCAAADAVSQPPAALRPSLIAALERAQAVGLSVDELVSGLRGSAVVAGEGRANT
jgi:DNA-binding XRE family transcriptional regulator